MTADNKLAETTPAEGVVCDMKEEKVEIDVKEKGLVDVKGEKVEIGLQEWYCLFISE